MTPSELVAKGCLQAIQCGTQIRTRATDVLPGRFRSATDAGGGPRSNSERDGKLAAADGRTASRK